MIVLKPYLKSHKLAAIFKGENTIFAPTMQLNSFIAYLRRVMPAESFFHELYLSGLILAFNGVKNRNRIFSQKIELFRFTGLKVLKKFQPSVVKTDDILSDNRWFSDNSLQELSRNDHQEGNDEASQDHCDHVNKCGAWYIRFSGLFVASL